MLCARCGFTNAPGASACTRCGGALAVVRDSLGARGAGKIDTSWMPAAKPRAGVTAAASGLVPNHPSSSIWQVQASTASVFAVPGAQAAAAIMLPGALIALIYGIYQVVWRRGIFATIAADPIGVGDFTARRSDSLNIVLLVVTIALVVLACGGAAWWILSNKLARSLVGVLGFLAGGILVTVVAAVLCQAASPSVISAAYIVGGIGCFGIAGGLGGLVARAVQAVTGDTRWIRTRRAPLPRTNPAGPGLAPGAVSSLIPTAPAAADLRSSGLVPAAKPAAKADWSALKKPS
jgi:hypothetical protein